MTLGEYIQTYLDENQMSQREFAKQCGDISAGYINMLIKGVNPSTKKPIVPNVKKLNAIARGMGRTLNELFTDVEDLAVSFSTKDVEPEEPKKPPLIALLDRGMEQMSPEEQERLYQLVRIAFPKVFPDEDAPELYRKD